MSLAYGIISIIALILIGVCIALDRKKEIWLLLLFISIFICDVGYFMLSISKTLDLALMANRVAYFGNVFLPFFMLMMVLNLCEIDYRKWLPLILAFAGVVMFGIAASPGYLTVYYKTVSLKVIDGAAMLVREYGPLHFLYYVYLFLYFGVMLFIVVYSIVRKKIASYIHGAFLLFAVFINIMVWFIEQLLPRGFEFLSITYVLSEALLLFLYGVFKKYNMKQRIICVWTVAFGCVGIAILCKTAPAGSPEYCFLNLIRSFIYIGMYYMWRRIVCHGIIQKTLRHCFGGISGLLVFWIAVSACKHYIFPSNITVVRYLWYSYYIPQIMIVVLSLTAALMVGKGENARPGKWGLALFGGGVGLILFVLTNDLHQLVFSFPEGQPWTNEACIHQSGYYLIMALIGLGGIAVLILLVRKCRVPGRKKFAAVPFMCLIFMIGYAILYFVEGSFVNVYLNDMTTVSCLIIAALSESVIESGLLQTNIGYDSLFQSSSLAMQITDNGHRVHYTSESARTVPAQTLAAADIAPIMLDHSIRLSGAAIRGGHVYWQENVAELLSVQEKLEITQEELRDTGDILKAESEQKAHWLRLEEENRLYDLVETQIAPQVTVLRELTARLRQTDDINTAKRLLGKIVIIGTYIKRRSNLIFVARQEHRICIPELILCMNESAENLKLYGVECRIQISDCEEVLPEIANTVYDLFEAVIEKCMDTASTILLHMEPEEGKLLLTICADCSDDLADLCRLFPGADAWQDEDDLWYLNMAFEKGGVRV